MQQSCPAVEAGASGKNTDEREEDATETRGMVISSSSTKGVRTSLQVLKKISRRSKVNLLCPRPARQVAGKPRIPVEGAKTPLVSRTREKCEVLQLGLCIRWSRSPHLPLYQYHPPARSVKNPDIMNRFQQRVSRQQQPEKGKCASHVKWGDKNPSHGIKFGGDESNAAWGHQPCA